MNVFHKNYSPLKPIFTICIFMILSPTFDKKRKNPLTAEVGAPACQKLHVFELNLSPDFFAFAFLVMCGNLVFYLFFALLRVKYMAISVEIQILIIYCVSPCFCVFKLNAFCD